MEKAYNNVLGSERTVEVVFVEEALKKYYSNGAVLDVGGIPTNETHLQSFYDFIRNNNIQYEVSDFRPCKYQGDFVQIDFGSTKFNTIIFLSSLEHFPQCTESDLTYREGYDRLGYEKALSILNDGGHIILTVPFGKHTWQPYHQNYDWQGLLNLTKGSTVVESYTYSLQDNTWTLTDPYEMSNILYTDRAYGVGCFILQKN